MKWKAGRKEGENELKLPTPNFWTIGGEPTLKWHFAEKSTPCFSPKSLENIFLKTVNSI